MKIISYHTGNLCVCTSIAPASINSNNASSAKKMSSKKVVVAAADNDSPFLIPVYIFKDANKESIASLRHCLKNNIYDRNFVVFKKSHVEQVGDYFVEIDETITKQTATPEQLEQIQKFEALLRPFEKSRSL